MKNISKNTMVKVALAIIAVVILATVVKGCFGDKGPMIAADSAIAATNQHVYYNDINNDLYKLTLSTGEYEIFVEDCKVLDVRENEILAKNGVNLIIMDSETGGVLSEYDGINTNDAVLTDKYIYYKNPDTNQLLRAVKDGGLVEEIALMENIKVNDFDVYNDTDIFFTADTDRIVRFNPDTLFMMTYAEGVKVTDLSVNDGYLLYVNGNDDYCVYSRDVDETSEVKIKGIKTKDLEFKNGKIFYMKNAGKEKKEYELEIYSGHSH